MVGWFWKNQTNYLAGTELWDRKVGPLEVPWWVRLHSRVARTRARSAIGE